MSPKRDAQQMTLIRDRAKGYGFSLAHHLYIKEIDDKGVAANDGGIRPGDVLLKVNFTLLFFSLFGFQLNFLGLSKTFVLF